MEMEESNCLTLVHYVVVSITGSHRNIHFQFQSRIFGMPLSGYA